MSETDFELKDYLEVIRRRIKYIILVTLFMMLSAGIISFLLPKVYQSSIFLEVGRIYLGSPSEKLPQFLEEPETVAELIVSEGTLNEVRRQLKIDALLAEMEESLEVTTFLNDKKYLPILKITCLNTKPQKTVEVLNALSTIIIKEHSQKYKLYKNALENKIELNRQKISAIKKKIAAQVLYMALSQKYINKGEDDSDEFSKDLTEFQPSQSSPLDILFLQSSSLSEKMHVTELARWKAQLDVSTGKNQEEIADNRIEIVDLKSQIELSSPTEIRSPAVLPEKPVKPQKKLIILIAGLLGLAFSTLFVFFQEYLKR